MPFIFIGKESKERTTFEIERERRSIIKWHTLAWFWDAGNKRIKAATIESIYPTFSGGAVQTLQVKEAKTSRRKRRELFC